MSVLGKVVGITVGIHGAVTEVGIGIHQGELDGVDTVCKTV
jgi:hypothetical protein